MFANCQMGGQSIGFPDTCNIPAAAGAPVPTPLPNTATGMMGIPPSTSVFFSCTPAHNMTTTVPLTNGDEAGVMMGVASGTVMGPERKLTAAFTCLVGGKPATRMSSMTLQNSTNCPGGSLVPSQFKVLILSA